MSDCFDNVFSLANQL